MGYFQRSQPGGGQRAHGRSQMAGRADRVLDWLAGIDGELDDEPAPEQGAGDPLWQLIGDGAQEPAPRFPLAAQGYNRAAVDDHVLALERELERLRGSSPGAPPPISDELERIGEQTASILVVAHDQASETTRLAQQEAERCVADAAANAVSITARAQRRLHELDAETDSVWRERERLLADVRAVSAALAALADQAAERFPAEGSPPEQWTEEWAMPTPPD